MPFVLLLGFSGVLAQVLILRELLVNFSGNELTIGIILANWLLGEALGAYFFGRAIERSSDPWPMVSGLQIGFLLFFVLSVYFSRVFKPLIGVPFGEGIGLVTIFFVSLAILLPISFCHGALFSSSCKLCASISRAYAWETAGSLLGGLALTYLLIPHLNTFQIVFFCIFLNLAVFLLYRSELKRGIKICLCFASLVFIASLFVPGPEKLNSLSIKKQWSGQEVADYRNSLFGNIVAVRKNAQTTFFHNGMPVITTPDPDVVFSEEFGNLPLLFHPDPKEVLVAGAGAGGVISEILKYDIRKLDYTELDPGLIESLYSQGGEMIKRELRDKRVRVVNLDGRFFLRTSEKKYDLLLVGISEPDDLESNRYFSREFFALAKKRLAPGGIVALWLPGSLTYLGPEYRNLNAGILAALRETYAYTRVITGDYNIYLSSDSGQIKQVTPGLLAQRIKDRGISTRLLIPEYLAYRVDSKLEERFLREIALSRYPANSDFRPSAIFEMQVIWNKQFSPATADFLSFFRDNPVKLGVLAGALVLVAYLLFLRRRKGALRAACAYSIFTTGFFGMMINLMLIFSFQVFYGYLYQQIGILISIYMAGIAAGSIFFSRAGSDLPEVLPVFRKIETAIIIFTILLGCIIYLVGNYFVVLPAVFTLLFLVSGFLLGGEFPLAGRLYRGLDAGIAETSGVLYSADLAGGWLAGILGGVFFLPLFGLFFTCLFVALLKVTSLLGLSIAGKFSVQQGRDDVG